MNNELNSLDSEKYKDDEEIPYLDYIVQKQKEMQPDTVDLLLCPGCGKYGVPIDSNRSYTFCLKCGYSNARLG